MQSILASTFKMFFLICFGYLLKKRGHITDSGEGTLSTLVTAGAIPLYILANVLSVEASEVSAESLSGISLLSTGYYIAAALLLTLYFKNSKRFADKWRLSVALGMFANAGFIGIPLMAELMGAKGALLATVSNLFYQVFFYTYGMYLHHPGSNVKENLKNLLRLPVVWATLLAMALFLLRVKLPGVLLDSLNLVGGLCFPLSMLTIGCMLTHMPFKSVFSDRDAYIVTGFRLLLAPALMLLAVRLLHVPDDIASAAVLLFGLPVGSLSVMYAKAGGTYEEYATRTLVQSSLLMLVTTPLWMWLLSIT